MAHTLFISDLHLGAKKPHITQLFAHFMQHTAPRAEALYVLGDLFEYWAGDDDLGDRFHRQVVRLLRDLADSGTRLYIMHGNRDFLMAEKLADACSASMLPDPVLLELYGVPTLITHGDILCTDDADYQSYRSGVHEPAWQRQFLAQPLAQRKSLIEQLRSRSENEKLRKSDLLMDANDAAVAGLLRGHGYPRLIHGHTHRRMHHLHTVDDHDCERWVLGDWNETGNALRCDAGGCAWETIACPA
ncbi:MAG: UDP-2,3-diacylglucosamine diphosphatase [Nitrosomonadales bacterium]|nr:UDP-2,3-diacylglucosamine diphosphatase [Nitrosomonadales bacterium]